jgi:hypothetical protein
MDASILEPLQSPIGSLSRLDKNFLGSEGFIRWGFGESKNLSTIESKSSDFFFHFYPSLEKREFIFRKEVFRACEQLDKKRGKKEIALCIGGGIFSEALAETLEILGIPFQMFFLTNWGLNQESYRDYILPIEKRLKRTVNVVQLDRLEFAKTFKDTFQEFGTEYPNCLILAKLFSLLSKEYFLVMADGHFNREGTLYAKMAETLPKKHLANRKSSPFSTSSVFYYLLAKKHHAQGEFYFFRSTPELVAATILHPGFSCNYPITNMRELLYSEFPNINRRAKSSNWDSERGKIENLEIRKSIFRLAEKNEDLKFWKSSNGTLVDLEEIFIEN